MYLSRMRARLQCAGASRSPCAARLDAGAVGALLRVEQALVVLARELAVDRQPHRRAVVAPAGQADRELDARVAARHRLDVARVLLGREHLLEQAGQLHFAEDAARLHVGQHALERADVAGQRSASRPGRWCTCSSRSATCLKLSPRRCSSVACSFSSTVARICSSFFSLPSCSAASRCSTAVRTSRRRRSLPSASGAAARPACRRALTRVLASRADATALRSTAASRRAGCGSESICSFCVRATSPPCVSSVCWNASAQVSSCAQAARCAAPRRAARARAARRCARCRQPRARSARAQQQPEQQQQVERQQRRREPFGHASLHRLSVALERRQHLPGSAASAASRAGRARRSGCRPPGWPSRAASRRWRWRCAASARRSARSAGRDAPSARLRTRRARRRAMRRSRSAAASAASSTTPPRAMLVSVAVGFISASSAAPISVVRLPASTARTMHEVVGLAQQLVLVDPARAQRRLDRPASAASGCDRSPACRSRARRAARSPGRCGPCRGCRASRRARRCR